MAKDIEVQAIAKGTTKGQPVSVVNTLATKALVVNLHLEWKDPTGTVRDFPENFEVIPVLHMSDGTKVDAPVQKVKAKGRVSFLLCPVQKGMIMKTWTFEKFTIRFATPEVVYLLCEKRLDATKSCLLRDRVAVNAAMPVEADRPRAFALPKAWSLADSDWAVESTEEPKSWVAADKVFKVIISNKRHDVGSKATPVKLTLDPHWQFLRWVYYDRWLKGDKRLSIPQIWVHGYLDAASSAGDPDSRSNWNEGGAADGKETVQCLPWIIQKAGAAKPDNKIQIRLKTPAHSYVRSESSGKRTLISGVEKKTPDVFRLRFYDLPADWRSTKYYGRMTGPVKEDRFEKIVTEKTKLDRPLTFSLDDIVLVDKDLKPIAWVPNDRVAIISHLFDNINPETNAAVADLSNTGVYKPDTAAKMDYFTKKPEGAAIEKDRNYISDYPDWTRLLAAKGNLYDVFHNRTQESAPAVAGEVIGARAAVRWIDATDAFPGINMFVWNAVSSSWVNQPDNKPHAGRMFDPTRPPLTEAPFFKIQPYFEQRYGVRYREAFNPANDEGGGRFDMTLLRCCNAVDRKEIAVNLHYFRFNFIFHAAPAIGEEEYKNKIISNVNDRWNGKDAINAKRAWVLPVIDKPLKIPVIWFGQALDIPLAQFKVDVRAHSATARDNRGGQSGTGESTTESYMDHGNFFASAHENGHADALPDEYNERWDGASYGQLSYKSNLPGDPYEPDGRGIEFHELNSPMMNGNQTMRNRYFWQSAEFARRCCSNLPFKVSYDTYPDYVVPPHPTAGRTFTYWPIEHTRDFVPAVVAPLTGTRGKADLYLYTLGKDQYPLDTLPKAETPAGATEYDGVLVVIVKLKVTLPSGTTPAATESTRKSILQAMTGALRRLNNKFYATGKVRQGTDQKWEFKRCLIHFSPRYVVSNFVHATNATFAADIDTAHSSHFEVVLQRVDPPVSKWHATPVAVELPATATFTGTVPATLQADARLTTLTTALTEYHALNKFDLAARIAKVKTIVAQDGTLAELIAVRGDWDVASQGEGRGAPETSVDTALGLFEAAVITNYTIRIGLIDTLIATAGLAATALGLLPAILNPGAAARVPVVNALKARAEEKKLELQMFKAVADLAKKAKTMQTYLEAMVVSRKLIIQYKDTPTRQAAIEDGFYSNFPGMLGIYKLPADLVEADFLPIVRQVVTTTPAVAKV